MVQKVTTSIFRVNKLQKLISILLKSSGRRSAKGGEKREV
jgi:hypothetical protein